jgi:hypothetical protein
MKTKTITSIMAGLLVLSARAAERTLFASKARTRWFNSQPRGPSLSQSISQPVTLMPTAAAAAPALPLAERDHRPLQCLREIKKDEIEKIKAKSGKDVKEFVVAYDALASTPIPPIRLRKSRSTNCARFGPKAELNSWDQINPRQRARSFFSVARITRHLRLFPRTCLRQNA